MALRALQGVYKLKLAFLYLFFFPNRHKSKTEQKQSPLLFYATGFTKRRPRADKGASERHMAGVGHLKLTELILKTLRNKQKKKMSFFILFSFFAFRNLDSFELRGLISFKLL